jgi:hypothetical protein
MTDRKAIRFEWKGTPLPDKLRLLAEVQARPLAECGGMRALTIECRPRPEGCDYRAQCRCADRNRSILAARPGLALTIEAFRAAQKSRCL